MQNTTSVTPSIPMNTDEDNPFSVFDEIPPMLAFCHMQYGVEGLRALLQMFVDPTSAPAEIKREHGEDWPKRCYISQKDLERYAAELEAVGLPQVAAIVAEYAADIPPPSNPHPEGSANWRDWNRLHTGGFDGYLYDDIDRACVVANRLNK
jgi:hypothetical protein